MSSRSGVRHICVIGTPWPGGLGDALLFNVFLEIVGRAMPDGDLTYVVGEGPAMMLFAGGHLPVQRVVTSPSDYDEAPHWWERFFEQVREAGCDCCVFEPVGQAELLPLAARHRISTMIGIATGDASDQLLTVPIKVFPAEGRDRADLLDHATAFASALDLPAPPPDDVVPAFRYHPEPVPDLPTPVVAVHPGGAPDWNRRWPLNRYAGLCRELAATEQASFVLIGTAEEAPELGSLRRALQSEFPHTRVSVSAGRSLHWLASEIARADVLIGNDSAPAHLAAGVGTPSVVLYGPSINEPWWHRAYTKHLAVNHHHVCGTDERCLGSVTAPCRYSCPYPYQGDSGPYPRCLVDIEVDEVLAAVRSQLANRSTSRSEAAAAWKVNHSPG